MLSENVGRRDSYPSSFYLFNPFTKRMIFCFFSQKSFSIWPILMADLVLHNFLHLLMYVAAQTVLMLMYSTKKQWHNNFKGRNKRNLMGVWHIFNCRFFSWISVSQAPWYCGRFKFFRKFAEIFANVCLSPASKKPAISCSLVSMTPAINPCLVVNTVDKFLTGVNDTSKQLLPGTTTPAINLSQVTMTPKKKFIAGDNDTGEQLLPMTLTPALNYCRWQEQGRHGGGEESRRGQIGNISGCRSWTWPPMV